MPNKMDKELKRKFGAYLKVSILNAKKEYLIELNKIIKTETSLDEVDSIVYTVLELPDLVNLKDQKGEFDRNLFHAQPDAYESNFLTYAKAGNVFISSHFCFKYPSD